MQVYVNEERFWGKNDSETIQNAVNYIEKAGGGTVVIPRKNARTGEELWRIDETILLPSSITVILDGAHLRLETGVRSNVFRNRNAWTEIGKTMEGEQHDIRILGEGNAVIDGGFPNGLCEQLRRSRPDLYPHMAVNLLLFFHNVRDFEVRGIRFIESRWWATCFMFCRYGRISELDFRMYGNLENQDGVDLRIGCENITIENITGITGDDTVAMTAWPYWDGFEKKLHVKGKSLDIHDITVRNVTSSTHGCSLVRFLNCDGAKEYNITVENITDTGKSISGCGVIIGVGNDSYAPVRPHGMGEFSNVTIRNLKTCAQEALQICEACENVLIENVSTYGEGLIGVTLSPNFTSKNMTVRNFDLSSDEADSFLTARCEREGALDGLTMEKVHVNNAKAIFRGRKAEVDDLSVDHTPSEGIFTENIPTLPHPYGRYHRYFHDELMKNRPANSRWSNEDYDI